MTPFWHSLFAKACSSYSLNYFVVIPNPREGNWEGVRNPNTMKGRFQQNHPFPKRKNSTAPRNNKGQS